MVDGNYVDTGKTAVTDSAGHYKFEGILPGTYRIQETQPAGYLSVGDTVGTVDGLPRGVITTVDILSSINLDGGEDSINNDFAETLPATLSGHVYYDANNNGVRDAGESPIAGVTVKLLDAKAIRPARPPRPIRRATINSLRSCPANTASRKCSRTDTSTAWMRLAPRAEPRTIPAI